MKHIIPNFDSVIGLTCNLNAVYNMTSYNKCKYSETDLFFLCNDLNIEYNSDLNYISSRLEYCLQNMEKEANIKFNAVTRNNNEDILEQLFNILTGNNLILLSVNTNCLTFNSVYANNINRYHAILLYGIDLKNNLAYIADPHLREPSGQIAKFQGAVPLQPVLDSIYRFSWFDFGDKKDLSKIDIFKIAKENFTKFISEGNVKEEAFYGVSALRRYIDDFPKLALLDDLQFVETCTNINYLIKVCSFNYVNCYLISFIKENSQYISMESANILNKCEEISLEWIKAALSVLKLGKSRKKDKVNDVAEKCKNLFQKQMVVYIEFAKLLNAIV